MSQFKTISEGDLKKILAEKRETLRASRFGVAGSRARNVKEGRTLRACGGTGSPLPLPAPQPRRRVATTRQWRHRTERAAILSTRCDVGKNNRPSRVSRPVRGNRPSDTRLAPCRSMCKVENNENNTGRTIGGPTH